MRRRHGGLGDRRGVPVADRPRSSQTAGGGPAARCRHRPTAGTSWLPWSRVAPVLTRPGWPALTGVPGRALRPDRHGVRAGLRQFTAGVVSTPLVIRSRCGYIGAVVVSPSIACTGATMSYARQMLDTYPRAWTVDAGVLAATIDALSDCAQACNADNAADLGEQHVTEMVRCIRLCLDCVDVCTATPWGSSAARRSTTPASPGRCCRPAWPSAGAAAMSASGMPICRTAGSAPRPAGAASGPAGSSWTP
jgi:hypothetical protein